LTESRKKVYHKLNPNNTKYFKEDLREGKTPLLAQKKIRYTARNKKN